MDELVSLDKWLLLTLNGSQCAWLDSVMWQLSDTRTWLLVAFCLLLLVFRQADWRPISIRKY